MKSPEEVELDGKLVELAALQTELAEKELELFTLETSLAAFNQLYLRIVGVKFAELDRIEAEIAEEIAASDPSNTQKMEGARRAREKAAEGQAAVNEALTASPTVHKSEVLKKLYREAAKKMHPDLAVSASDRQRREHYMARANDAYQRGDEQALRAVLDEWQHSPESVIGEGVQAELVRTIRQLAQIKRRLLEIESRLARLQASDLFALHTRVVSAEKEGRDLLKELADAVDVQICDFQARLSKRPRKERIPHS